MIQFLATNFMYGPNFSSYDVIMTSLIYKNYNVFVNTPNAIISIDNIYAYYFHSNKDIVLHGFVIQYE